MHCSQWKSEHWKLRRPWGPRRGGPRSSKGCWEKPSFAPSQHQGLLLQEQLKQGTGNREGALPWSFTLHTAAGGLGSAPMSRRRVRVRLACRSSSGDDAAGTSLSASGSLCASPCLASSRASAKKAKVIPGPRVQRGL